MPASGGVSEIVRPTLENPLTEVIDALQERLKTKHQMISNIGYEWEFQILDDQGEPVFPPYALLMGSYTSLKDHPFIQRIYSEEPHGVFEIATKPLPPLEAANAMVAIQAQVAQWAKEKGYHLSAAPVISNGHTLDNIGGSGTTGMHINSSLVAAGADKDASFLLIQGGVISRGDRYTHEVDGFTANVTGKILKINAETPLWSWHGAQDSRRLGQPITPNFYNVGDNRGPTALALRANDIYVHEPTETGHDPLKGQAYYNVRVEERLPNSRVDPYVAAFRTLLAQYDALEHPAYPLNAIVDVSTIKAGPIPDWKGMQAAHLPDDSIVKKYLGDLYDESTLAYIDQRGCNPFMPSWESNRFAIRENAGCEAMNSTATSASGSILNAADPANHIAPDTIRLDGVTSQPTANAGQTIPQKQPIIAEM